MTEASISTDSRAEQAIRALRRRFAKTRFPDPGPEDHCAYLAIEYLRLRGGQVNPGVRQTYVEMRHGSPLFGEDGVVSTVRELADAYGMVPRPGPTEARTGDVLFLRGKVAFGISTDGPREALALVNGDLVTIYHPRINIAWDVSRLPGVR